MAFPTRVDTVAFMYGYCGPFVSSAGNVYVFGYGTAAVLFHAFKATDPSSSFSSAASFTPTSSKPVQDVDVFQVGDVLHVVTETYSASTSVDLRYHTFDMSSDTWTISNETIKAAYDVDVGFSGGVGIVVRSDGDVIVLYNGVKSTSMGSSFGKVKYARREAAVWTIDVAVDDAVAGTNWFAGSAAISSVDDRACFSLTNITAGDSYARTLSSANALDTLTATDTTGSTTLGAATALKSVSYDVTGTAYSVHLAYDSSIATLNSIDFTVGATPTYNLTGDITGATNAYETARASSLAKDDSTVYNVFIEDTTNDLKYQTKAHGAAWGAVTALSTVDARQVAANIYTRGGSKVLAYIYRNGADGELIYYNELTLTAADSYPFIVDMEMDFGSRRRRR